MSEYIEGITDLTAQLVLPGLKIIRENLREIMNAVDSAIVQSYINLMNFRIGPMAGREGKAPPSFVLQRTIRKSSNLTLYFAHEYCHINNKFELVENLSYFETCYVDTHTMAVYIQSKIKL